ncbi:MAG: hypothetical protein DRG24_07080 [Epsilonproteobacteria bacterium]|nr:MAG: hypothetical protein DRG24_07080 [Campylobacterota bacterium]
MKYFNVFIGKNGTGKTYFAKLIYFLTDHKYSRNLFEKMFSDKIDKAFHNKSDLLITVAEQKKFTNSLENDIKNNYALMIKANKKLFSNFSFNIEIDTNEDFIYMNKTKEYDEYKFLCGIEFIKKTFDNLFSYYLPAARANYMTTYKNLIESILKNVRASQLRKSSNVDYGLPEIELNFLLDIQNVDTAENGFFSTLALKIEREIFLNGRVSIRNPKSQDMPTYEYVLKEQKTALDLIAASSAVAELSPLILYLRHIIVYEKDNFLIIDEPELSLHPEAQAKLVSILVEAVNQGLKLILVTHSPYIIEALNNHLLRDKIDKYELPNNIKKVPKISYEKVGSYLFEDKTIKNIMNEEFKIIDDKLLNTFNSIGNLYDRMSSIEWESSDNGVLNQ